MALVNDRAVEEAKNEDEDEAEGYGVLSLTRLLCLEGKNENRANNSPNEPPSKPLRKQRKKKRTDQSGNRV